MLAFLSWYLLISLLGALTLPLARLWFGRLPEQGYTLSRALGLLLWGFGFWILVSLGVLQNDLSGLILSLLGLAALMFFLARSEILPALGWLRRNWGLVLLSELLFLAAFTALAFLRANAPEALGTEKPMELAFINAVLRSPTFPPQDPWLSGYAISYYYFGYVLTAMLAKFTASSGGAAFNLMIALVFALSAIGSLGLLYNLLKVFRAASPQPAPQNRDLSTAAALLGPLFLLLISNLEGFLEVLHRRGLGWVFDPNGGAHSAFWAWLRMKDLSDPPALPLAWVPERFWWWWRAARVLHDYDLRGNFSEVIDEFPFFSYLLADLHPHVLAMPFGLLAAALALNFYLQPAAPRSQWRGLRLAGFEISLPLPVWKLLPLAALLLGGLAFLNTWDFPTYLALSVSAFVLAQVQREGWNWNRAEEALALGLPLGALSILLYLPFFLSFDSQAGGLLPNIIHPTRGVYLWIMFAPLLSSLFLLLGQYRSQMQRAKAGFGLAALLIAALWLFSTLAGILAADSPIGRWFITAQGETSTLGVLAQAAQRRLEYGAGLLTIFAALGAALSLLLNVTPKQAESPQEHLLPADSFLVSENATPTAESRPLSPLPFVWLLILLGAGLILFPEFFFLRDLFGSRMNTVFKFYYQAWALWSLAAAFGATLVLARGGWLARLSLVTVMGMGLVYPILSPDSRTNHFSPFNGLSLDAAAYFSGPEAEALTFLQTQPYGVLVEAVVPGSYNESARFATLSGYPAVLGWTGHEEQWRGGREEIGTRQEDVQTLYESPSLTSTLEIARRYQVRYIIVSGLERQKYRVNETKFSALPLLFRQDETAIYLVP